MTPVELQTALAQEGCYQGHIDGIIGSVTLGAIKQFQAEQDLPQNGLVDQFTLEALDRALHANPDLPANFVNASTLVAAWESVEDGNPNTVGLEAYFDAVGVATLGYGHVVLDRNGQMIRAKAKGDPQAKMLADAAVARLYGRAWVTLSEAKALLSIDLNHLAGQIAPLLRGMPTSQAQFDAMGCLAFNIGARGFATSSVLARHKAGLQVSKNINVQLELSFSKAGKMDGTMEGAFTSWSFASGEWLLGLFRRHLCEAMVYRGDSIDVALSTARAVR